MVILTGVGEGLGLAQPGAIGEGACPLDLPALGGVIGLNAEKEAAHIQLGLGEHTEVLHLQIRRGSLNINIPQGEHSAAAQHHHTHRRELNRGGQRRPAQRDTFIGLAVVWEEGSAHGDSQHHRKGHHHHR